MFAAVIAIVLAAGCGSGEPSVYGEPVDVAEAVPLQDVLGRPPGDRADPVTVSGSIGEVCRSAGCWFVLQGENRDGDPCEILVDLKGGATFTVSPRIQGRSAVVKGRLVGEGADLRLAALGLVLR